MWTKKLATMVDVEAAALAVQGVIWDDEREADTLSPPNFGIIRASKGELICLR